MTATCHPRLPPRPDRPFKVTSLPRKSYPWLASRIETRPRGRHAFLISSTCSVQSIGKAPVLVQREMENFKMVKSRRPFCMALRGSGTGFEVCELTGSDAALQHRPSFQTIGG
jgi:hypothetical protein